MPSIQPGAGVTQSQLDAAIAAAQLQGNQVIPVSPTNGQTVAFNNTSVNQTLYVTPAGVLASLAVTLPNNASSRVGQDVTISTTQTLTLMNVGGAASIINNPTTLTGGSTVTLRKTASDTWMQL